MKTIIAYKNKNHFNLSVIEGLYRDNLPIRGNSVPYVKMKDGTLIATTDFTSKASALSVLSDDGPDLGVLCKKTILDTFIPMILHLFKEVHVDLSVDDEKYISMKGCIILVKDERAFIIDSFFNVYEIRDYMAAGNYRDCYNIELLDSNEEDYPEVIRATHERLYRMNLNHGKDILTINADTKEEALK